MRKFYPPIICPPTEFSECNIAIKVFKYDNLIENIKNKNVAPTLIILYVQKVY